MVMPQPPMVGKGPEPPLPETPPGELPPAEPPTSIAPPVPRPPEPRPPPPPVPPIPLAPVQPERSSVQLLVHARVPTGCAFIVADAHVCPFRFAPSHDSGAWIAPSPQVSGAGGSPCCPPAPAHVPA